MNTRHGTIVRYRNLCSTNCDLGHEAVLALFDDTLAFAVFKILAEVQSLTEPSEPFGGTSASRALFANDRRVPHGTPPDLEFMLYEWIGMALCRLDPAEIDYDAPPNLRHISQGRLCDLRNFGPCNATLRFRPDH